MHKQFELIVGHRISERPTRCGRAAGRTVPFEDSSTRQSDSVLGTIRPAWCLVLHYVSTTTSPPALQPAESTLGS